MSRSLVPMQKKNKSASLFVRYAQDMKRHAPYSLASAGATLRTEVSDSYLGWLWWVLDPLLFMLVYTFISLIVFQKSMPYFPVFVFIGLTIWQLFNRTITASVSLIRKNRTIITKVYLPKHMLVLENMFVSAFKFGISMLLVFVLMVCFKVPFPVRIWQLVPEFIVLVCFTYGLALFLMHIGVYVKDMSNVITVLLRLVFYMCGVFYDIASRVPAPWNTWLVRANPVSLVMSGARNSLLYGKDPDWLFLGIWFVISLGLIVCGLKLVYRWENNYAKVA